MFDLASRVTGFVSIFAFAFLVGFAVGASMSAIGGKQYAITAVIKKFELRKGGKTWQDCIVSKN